MHSQVIDFFGLCSPARRVHGASRSTYYFEYLKNTAIYLKRRAMTGCIHARIPGGYLSFTQGAAMVGVWCVESYFLSLKHIQYINP